MRFEKIKNLEELRTFFETRGFEFQKHDENLIKIDKSHFLQIKVLDSLDQGIISQEHRVFKKQFRDVPYQLLVDKSFQKFVFHRDYGTPIRFTYNKTKRYARETEGSILKKLNLLKYEDADFNTSINNLFDVKEIVNKFYNEFKQIKKKLSKAIKNIGEESELYAQILLDRIIFLYFLQTKGILSKNFLSDLYYNKKKTENYYRDYLRPLFFQVLNTEKHSKDLVERFGDIPYLNGGLFAPKNVENNNGNIEIIDSVWDDIFSLLNSYEWVIEEEKGDSTTLTPSILGHIYEKSVIAATQKDTGSYYTPEEITTYISKNTIYPYITDRINDKLGTNYKNIWDELLNKVEHTQEEIKHIKFIYFDVLKKLRICDNACGSGAFLIAAQQILVPLYWQCIKILEDKPFFRQEWNEIRKYKRIGYYIKKTIIINNLYGVDLQKGAVEIAKLRLWLSMVSEMELRPEDIEPLPNIDYNLLVGNSLIGFIEPEEVEVSKGVYLEPVVKKQQTLVKEKKHQMKFTQGTPLTEIMKQREQLIQQYREESRSEHARKIRENIEQMSKPLRKKIDEKLYQKFLDYGINITWDEFEKIRPFHWGFEFYDVFYGNQNNGCGFDIIIGNPPWNAVKPFEKEFFSDYDPRLTKYGVDKIEAKKIIAELLRNTIIRQKWDEYKKTIEVEARYYKDSGVYQYQSDFICGRRISADQNYYKIFLERSFQLIVPKGFLGIIVPSGLHTDAGTKGLRKLFFDGGNVSCVYCFENRKGIFPGIHKSFKFDLFIVQNHGKTSTFYGAFMLHDVEVLKKFPHDALRLSWDMVKKISPDSHSVIEFKTQKDIDITNKLSVHPILRENSWLGKVELYTEFHMTNDSHLFNTEEKGLILYEGKMIEQYTPYFETNRYWVEESKGKQKLYGNTTKRNFDYTQYRIGFRDVASSTNRRSMIASLLPKNIFCGNTAITTKIFDKDGKRLVDEDKLIYLCGIFNSFTFDFLIRLRITSHLSMFFIYQMPVPIPDENSLDSIIKNVLLLTEDWKDFNELREKYGINGKKLDRHQRLEITAKIDAAVGKLYGLNREEMTYILDKFHHANQETEEELRTLEKLILKNY